jgi:murein tripeptide amidase MpaA
MAQTNHTAPPVEWKTFAETTNYRETPRYRETMEYARRLQDASPLIHVTTFGKSGEGRELPLIIAAEDNAFTPEAAKRSGKAVVLIQACIHAGESDGKDAGLALLRDIAISQTERLLLKNSIVLFIPIYNVDGHERFSAFNRINQNGPAEMGWRATTTNLNLNRDYMKADAPETRAWLTMWNSWKPDLFIDCHVTDGADYQYNITYQYEHFSNVPASIVEWEHRIFDGKVAPATEKAGNVVSSYLEFRDNRDLTKGINSFIGPPRFSTGYVPVRNRPALLIETHMLKDYKSRVKGTYDMLRATLEAVNNDVVALKQAINTAEEQVKTEGNSFSPTRLFPVQLELTEKWVPRKLKAVEYKTELSAISGAQFVTYGANPIELTVPLYDDARAVVSVAPPRYYVIPPQWQSAVEVVTLHGLKTKKLKHATELNVESYRFSDVKWSETPFEGRVRPSYKTTLLREKRTFPAGSLVIPLAQESARLAIYLFEPGSPDSFVAWGFFNPIFEQKEYAEAYVLEKLAREMMEKDPALRREFENRLANDARFASDSNLRLGFFYERSPYWDKYQNLYPVGRITEELDRTLLE